MTGPRIAAFRAIGTANRILVTEPASLEEATEMARGYLAELDAAASRFRSDSEITALAEAAARGPASAQVSPLLASYLREALWVAALTDGLVDPTVGSAVCAEGYDADLAVVRRRESFAASSTGLEIPGWRTVGLDTATGWVSVRPGTLLDLGASAKALAADRIARLLAGRLPGGFLVNLGGDIATSGDVPDRGWQVGVESATGTILQVVTGRGQAFATSSTQRRTWRTSTGGRHHVIDPRTGHSANTPWAQVTCAGATSLEANAATTAALVLGVEAPKWLDARAIPARLDGTDGSLVTTSGWPLPNGTNRGEAAA